MPRAGRELELLLAQLETLLGDADVTITSPDYIVGANSSERREVDVTLRAQVGSVPVLVAFECRDRVASQGVSWIDELATKRSDIRASQMIAVSASPFTRGAVDYAKSVGVELRTLADVGAVSLFEWMDGISFELYGLDIVPRDFEVFLKGQVSHRQRQLLDNRLRDIRVRDPIFYRGADEKVTFMDMAGERMLEAFRNAAGTKWGEWHPAGFSGELERPFYIDLDGEFLEVDYFATGLDVRPRRVTQPFTALKSLIGEPKAYRYSDEQGVIAEVAEYEILDTRIQGSVLRLVGMKLENGKPLDVRVVATVREEKVARNAPCPCGSGNKFKSCHGRDDPGRSSTFGGRGQDATEG